MGVPLPIFGTNIRQQVSPQVRPMIVPFTGGTSVAPPAITVAVVGLDATVTNTGGAATSINWGDGTTNTSLTHTYAYGGVYTATATNAGGSSAATFAANDVPMLLITQAYNAGGLWQNAAKTVAATADGDPVRVQTCPVTGVDLVAPSDSARPLLWEVGNGNWKLAFDSIDDYMSAAVTWSGSVGSQVTGFEQLATDSANGVCSAKASYSFNGDYYQIASSGYFKNFRASRLDAYGSVPVDLLPHTYAQTSGANYQIHVDGTQIGATTSTSWESPTDVVVGTGDVGNGSGYLDGLISASIWAKAGWTTTERNNVESFIAALNAN